MTIIRYLALSAILCLFIGCAAKSAPDKLVILKVFGDVNRVLNLKESGPGTLAEFHSLYPGIRVEVTAEHNEWRILHQSIDMLDASSANAPDIIEMPGSWVAAFASKNQLLPLDDWFAKLSAPNRIDYVAALLKSYSYEKRLYGLPSMIGIQYLYGRKELLPETGLPTTLDGLLALSREIQKTHGIQGVIFPSAGIHLAKFYHTLLMIELANTADDGRLTAHTRAYKVFSALVRENQPDYKKFSHAVAEGEFRSGRAGLSINGNYVWYLLSRSRKVGFPIVPEDVSIGYLPVASIDVEPVNYIWTRGYVINAKTKHPMEARLLLEYLTSTQSQFRRLRDRYILPARTSVAFYGDSLPGMRPAPAKKLYKTGENAAPFKKMNESPPGWKESTESIQRLLETALASGMTSAEVAGRMILIETMAR